MLTALQESNGLPLSRCVMWIFNFVHFSILPFYICGKGNILAPRVNADGATYQIDYKSLVQAALMYGTWYYTGSMCADNGKRITYNPTDPCENIPTINSRFKTLSFCWYCVVSLEDEAGDGLNLKNLGFENFYKRIGNTLFHVGPSHTYKQLK